MPFQVSPGVTTREIDLTRGAPIVSTTEGAFAGVFAWGPADAPTLISSGDELKTRFGKPNTDNFESWFSAANFLAYGNKLFVSRAIDADNDYNATDGGAENIVVKNREDYESIDDAGGFSTAKWVAKYPGELGNSLRISICDSADAFESTVQLGESANAVINVGSNTLSLDITGGTDAANNLTDFLDNINERDYLEIGNTTIGIQNMLVSSKSAVTGNTTEASATVSFFNRFTRSEDFVDNSFNSSVRKWEFYNSVDKAPSTTEFTNDAGGTDDELHIVIVDENGEFSGSRQQILEVHESLSRATDSRTPDGGTAYYRSVIQDESMYIWPALEEASGYSNTAANMSSSQTTDLPIDYSFDGGVTTDEVSMPFGQVARAIDEFANPEEIDISLFITGKSQGGVNGEQKANYIIDNITSVRKDCVVFLSPERGDVVDNKGNEASDIVDFRNSVRSTSYAFLDSGYKYQYDKYNDVYRWVPLNGDIAGLAVRTDSVAEPWFSPAGQSRGQIKNIAKLAYNPKKADRDILYKNDINPVTKFPGEGNLLFGDKTLLGYQSAFSRINVRRLFIVLEKTIATASRGTLFELNDEFTRAQFKNIVEPFLRDVQGRRGITDFLVVADETNNTPEVVDRNEFIGDIYIKPARSINFITLNFIAVRSGVEFSEIVGQAA